MGASRLFEIALRVFGLCSLFRAIDSLTSATSIYFGSAAIIPVPSMAYYIAAPVVVGVVVQFLLGAAILYWAPNIAAHFYPPGSEDGELHIAVGPGDVYRTACFVLGAYLLVQAAEPAGRLVISGFQGSTRQDQLAANAITATASLASGLLLVFGSRKIAELLSNLRYDPNTVPNQQLSFATLLILLAVIAVVLGLVRQLVIDS